MTNYVFIVIEYKILKQMGGTCYSQNDYLRCLFSDSVYSYAWLDNSFLLPGMGASSVDITVSGFSGGSAYANNFQVINSERIKGAALLSGYPYAIGIYLNEQ